MRRFRTLPLWILAPIYFVVLGGVYFAGGQVASPDRPLVVGLVGAVIFGALMTVVFMVFVARARREAGGAAELERIGKALKTGQVPQDIDVLAWSVVVERQDQLLRRALWLNPVVFGLLTPLALWLTFTRSPYWSLAAAFFAFMLVMSIVTTPRGLRRNAVIREELTRRDEMAVEADTERGAARGTISRDDDPAHTPPSP